MEGPNERGWWERWKKTVKDVLTTKRNHCQNYCKDEFMGKWSFGGLWPYHDRRLTIATPIAWGKALMAHAVSVKNHDFNVEDDMPICEVFHSLRGGSEDYTLFLDKFVRHVVGARKFDKLAVVMPISQFVMVSDEAFALLVYENQEARWKHMLKEGLKKTKIPAKYTDGGYANKETGRSRKSKGWDNEGIDKFNKLCNMVVVDRKAGHARDFEQGYLQHRCAIRDGSSRKASKKQVRTYTSDETVVDTVFHEMGADLVGYGTIWEEEEVAEQAQADVVQNWEV